MMKHKKFTSFMLAAVITVGTFFHSSAPVNATTSTDNLVVKFINTNDNNLGKGDAILLQSGKEYALIDGGNASGNKMHPNLKKALGDKKLKYVIMTHHHKDHCGGLQYLTKDNVTSKTTFFRVDYGSDSSIDTKVDFMDCSKSKKKIIAAGLKAERNKQSALDTHMKKDLNAKIHKISWKNNPSYISPDPTDDRVVTCQLGKQTIRIYRPVNPINPMNPDLKAELKKSLNKSDFNMDTFIKTTFVNNTSLIVTVDNKNGNALFLGDLTHQGLRELFYLSQKKSIYNNILQPGYYELCKLGHHGIRDHKKHSISNPAEIDNRELEIYLKLQAKSYFATTNEAHHPKKFTTNNCFYGNLAASLNDTAKIAYFTEDKKYTVFTIQPNGEITRK